MEENECLDQVCLSSQVRGEIQEDKGEEKVVKSSSKSNGRSVLEGVEVVNIKKEVIGCEAVQYNDVAHVTTELDTHQMTRQVEIISGGEAIVIEIHEKELEGGPQYQKRQQTNHMELSDDMIQVREKENKLQTCEPIIEVVTIRVQEKVGQSQRNSDMHEHTIITSLKDEIVSMLTVSFLREEGLVDIMVNYDREGTPIGMQNRGRGKGCGKGGVSKKGGRSNGARRNLVVNNKASTNLWCDRGGGWEDHW